MNFAARVRKGDLGWCRSPTPYLANLPRATTRAVQINRRAARGAGMKLVRKLKTFAAPKE